MDPLFMRLYDGLGVGSRMFASLHQRLNSHFDFMNHKARVNRHFNADASRDLIALIDEIRDVQQVMKRVGMDFVVADSYRQVLEDCSTFLVDSGGSPIPEDFKPIELVKYEQVFMTQDTQMHLPERRSNVELKMIGSGAYANVYRFIDPEYGIAFALKRAKRNLSPKDLTRFRNEFDLLKDLRFPYVLQVFRYFEDLNEYTMEHCDATLLDFINRNNARISFGTRKRIALQFLYGLNFLHSKRHLHRDISYKNVLVKKYDGGAVIVKISDFGLFKDPDSTLTKTESELRGTILDPTIVSFKEYNVANEIYAIGFVLSFIFSGRRDIGACTGATRAVIDKCVTLDLATRYPDVRTIIRDIETLESELAEVHSETPS
ncbi:MAG: protein kinase family protein [Dehalococcoidales bacterium]|nr:protein kinase family protein [Dehalococcoidales bacterium]